MSRRTSQSSLIVFALAVAAWCGSSHSFAASIPILNGDFEIVWDNNVDQNDVSGTISPLWYTENMGEFMAGGGSGPTTGFIPGWTSDNLGGFSHGLLYSDAVYTPSSIVGYMFLGKSVTNTLVDTLQPATTYTLKVDIGARNDQGLFTNLDYSVELLAAGSPLPLVGTNPVPVSGLFATGTWTYTSPAVVTPGQNLGIRITNIGTTSQVLVDNISLNAAIPEPASVGLLVMGGLTLLSRSLRRRPLA